MGFLDFFRHTDVNVGVKKYEATDDAVLLDVRTIEEYQQGHIMRSLNLPLEDISSIDRLVKDKSTPLFVYCYSGVRSGRATSYLKQAGYTNVINIGGIKNYRGKVEK